MGFSQFLGRDPDLVNEVRATLSTALFLVVGAAARDGTPQLLRDVLGRRIIMQTRQELSHSFHRVEQTLGDIIALAPRCRLVPGPLCLVPSARSVPSCSALEGVVVLGG